MEDKALNRFGSENDAVRDKKQRSAPDPVIMEDMEAVAEIANKLIPKFHDHLAGAQFLFLCRNRSTKSGGKPSPGRVGKATLIEKHLSRERFKDGKEADFVMTVALDVWNDYNPKQRIALVDHLLARCVGVEDETTGQIRYSIQPAPVQEFPEVAERNGQWHELLVEFAKSLRET